jgi:CO dehydrogenase/acetyl-CoA synthase beta subunit
MKILKRTSEKIVHISWEDVLEYISQLYIVFTTDPESGDVVTVYETIKRFKNINDEELKNLSDLDVNEALENISIRGYNFYIYQ